jgi:hypothetical protein
VPNRVVDGQAGTDITDLKAQAKDQLNALLTMADLKYINFIA